MPRNMSFAITTDQVRNQIKTVTRRLGWWFLKPGDVVNAVEKAMGLKKGEKVKRITQIRIVSANPEPLCAIDESDVVKEGFPELTPEEFIEMFCRHNKCTSQTTVNRIEFEYLS
ncbi:hypothetical protein HNR65_002148 [Desulfosalsimonas propionicica]|uniref:ASCH domain-containing protein n=1 Tax=Desulfosalsimonas propionicica TaxID=332175 RepID=A0A7W0C9Y9_9BACT|nr:hypothetical protein [Desulfosalsimonas propionicica]MBA2881817.1 hypothetical protein [Desulfosalsimonas propionicica]